jgi:spermidine synthase
MNKKLLSIGLLSLTILSTELFLTRLFSAEFYYTFAFLILSLAILGLGLGALFLRIFPKLNRPQLLPVWLSLTGLFINVAVPAVFYLNLDFAKLVADPTQIVKLVSAVLLLGSAYFFGGVALAQILKTNSDEIPKLYMSDLIGASVGVILFIIVMNLFGANVTLIFCSIPALFASFILAEKWLKIFPTLIIVLSLVSLIFAGGIPEQKRKEPAPVIYTHWDATAKIKLYEYDSTRSGLNIDNVANSPVYRFDGKWPQEESLKYQFNIDVRNLMKKFHRCCFLSLGAGGGTDVFQALQYNADEIHAVEVIPHINYLMKEGFLSDYSGNIYNDSRVKVITSDARAYIRAFQNKFDIIYSLSSNSWAALASGSFALAENYIFTTEAFTDYWRALSDSGYMSIEHQFYAPRLVAELIDALKALGVQDPNSHFAVYDFTALRRKVLLVSKEPLDEQTISSAYANSDPEVVRSTRVLYPPLESNKNNIINSIVQAGWHTVSDTARIDISPCTDNKPFIAQLGLLRNLNPSKLDNIPLYELTGFPLSRVIMLILLAICIVIIIPLNLFPFITKGDKLKFVPWLYFFVIGLGYMMVEVILIQKYALFIGSSIYCLALVLTVLLLSSGIGSRYSSKYTFKAIFLAIIAWLLADIFVFKQLFYYLGSLSFLPRMILSGILIAPIGFFMGMPFPKAASKFPNLVDWAFAVNGSASVIGSILIVLIATSFGYSIALLAALLIYLTAFLLCKNNLESHQ